MSRDRWENAITRAEAAETADERSAWIDLAREIRLETAWTWEKAAPRSGRAKAGKSAPPIGAATAKLA
jgi:hypothetical protein